MAICLNCHLEPVNDEKEQSDLCSEATGMNDGIGWRIDLCQLHASAPAMLDALNAVNRVLEGQMLPGPIYLSIEEGHAIKAAIAQATQ